MSALALIVAATLAQAGALRSDLALRGGGAGRSVVTGEISWSSCGSYASGAAITKGAGVSVGSSAGGTLCSSGAWAGPVSNGLAVTEAGAWFGGSGANGLTYRDVCSAGGTAQWSTYQASISCADPLCPVDPNTGRRMALITAITGGVYINNPVGTPWRYAYVSTASGDSPCNVGISAYSEANKGDCAATSAISECRGPVGSTGIFVAKSNVTGGNACTRWCQGGAQAAAKWDILHDAGAWNAVSSQWAHGLTKPGPWAARICIAPGPVGFVTTPGYAFAFSGYHTNSAYLILGETAEFDVWGGDGKFKSVIYGYDPAVAHCHVVGVDRYGAPFVRLDGISPATSLGGDSGATGLWTAAPQYMYIGGSDVNGSSPLNGWVRSIKISNTDRPGAVGFAASSTAQKVAVLGDSIFASYFTMWLNGTLGSEFEVHNYAVPGYESPQIRTAWQTARGAKQWDWVIYEGGVNDAAVGRSAADAWTLAKATIDEALADGAQVVAMTIGPWKDSSAWTIEKELISADYNSLLASYSAVGLTVLDERPITGTAGDGYLSLAPAYNSGDALHPNEAGKKAYAAAIKAVMSP